MYEYEFKPILLYHEGGANLLRHMLEEELKYEEKELAEFQKKLKKYKVFNLTLSQDKRGFIRFYCHKPGQKKRKYIKKSDEDFLRSIAYGRFVQETIDVLEQNIKTIAKLLETVRDSNPQSITNALPIAYRRAIEMLKITKDNQVIQSENPYKPEELVHEASNGLLVRSLGELIIANFLIQYNINFRYEKALKLKIKHVRKNGTVWEEKVTKYPDFTIFLADGNVIYWEHLGMFDNEDYRDTQYEKFKLYYDNDIYPSHNLIVTMDGKGKPKRTQEYIDIIEKRILPYM
ncbi:MAG: hypothetical protein II918_01255 [Firmicutes bacterium]|nr:hypothetical protein [Bacillota bacterium]